MPDPLDKQLVEAVLTRPRRARADVEEARLANIRPARAAAIAPVAEPGADDDDDLELGPDGEEPEAPPSDLGVVVVDVAIIAGVDHPAIRIRFVSLPPAASHLVARPRR